MANTVRYNVIIDISIDPSGATSGGNQVKQALSQYEQQVIDSQKRIDEQVTQSSQMRINVERSNADEISKIHQNSTLRIIELEEQKNKSIVSDFIKASNARKAQVQAETDFIAAQLKEQQALYAQQNQMFSQISARDPFQNATNLNSGQLRFETAKLAYTNGQNLGQQILQKDPFQFANNIPAGVQGQIFGLNSQISQQDPFQIQKLTPLNGVLKEIDANAQKAGQGMNIFASAFQGAFIGAIAGTAFRVLTEIPEKLIAITEESIKAASSFERTTNAFTAIAGSASAAKQELSDIADLAAKTPGLGLETAEQGELRLRAVGFAAKDAQDLIEGLSKVKIISGASQDSLDRFLYNLTQIKSEGVLTGRELRDALRELPGIAPVLESVFGTISAKKIASYGLKSDEVISELIAGLKKVQQVSGGSEDAFQKFNDSATKAERLFGEAFLAPGTKRLQELTAYLDDNASTWEYWGKIVSKNLDSTLTGIETLYTAIINLAKVVVPPITLYYVLKQISPDSANVYSKLAGQFAYTTLAPASAFLSSIGNIANAINPPQGGGNNKRTFEDSFNPNDPDQFKSESQLQKERTGKYPGASTGSYDDEVKLREKAIKKQQQLDDESVDNFAKNQKALKEQRETVLNDLQGYYDAQLSIINQGLTNTTQQELAKEQQRATLLSKYHADQDKVNQGQLDSLGNVMQDYINSLPENRRDTARNSPAFKAVQDDYNKEESKFELERIKNVGQEIEENNKLLRLKQQLREEDRQAKIQANSLQQTGVSQNLESQTFNIQRQIDIQGSTYQKGYQDLIDVTQKAYTQQTDLIYKNLNLQLQNEKLTQAERNNLIEETNLKIEDNTQKNSEKILQIQDEQYQKSLERTKVYTDQLIKSLSDSANLVKGSVSQFLQPDFNFGKFSRSTYDDKFGLVEGGQSAIRQLFGADNAEKIVSDIEKVKQGTMSFYELQREQLDLTHKKELEAINVQIRANEDLIKQEQIRAKGFLTERETGLKGLIDIGQSNKQTYLNQGNTTAADTAQATIDANKARLTDVQNQISIINKGGEVVTDTVRKLKNENLGLETEKIGLALSYNSEELALFAKQTEGLTETFKNLTEGQYDFVIKNKAQNDLIQQRIDLVTQIKTLELGYYKDSTVLLLQRALAYKQDIQEIELAEQNAILRSDKAKLQIGQKFVYQKTESDARLLEFFAQQKGVTDVLSDARINLLTDAYSGLDKVIQSLTKNFGFASDAIAQFLSGIIKLFLNQYFQKLFNVSQGGIGQGSSGSIFGNTSSSSQGGLNIGSLFGGNQGNGIFNFGSLTQGINSPTGTVISLPGGGNAINVNGSLSPIDSGINNATDLLKQIPSQSGGGIGGLLNNSGGLSGLLATGGASIAIGLFINSLHASSPLKGALQGGLVGLIAGAINRSNLRKKEEVIHNDAMLKALGDLDTLIANVQNGSVDTASALSQADQIKAQYIQSVSVITDKKTFNIANSASELGRIDAKIQAVKDAVNIKNQQKAREDLLVPTFASGGAVNPGYQSGMGNGTSDSNMGYFASAGMMARYSNTEYVLDAETTRNIGIPNLDSLRQTRGKNFSDLRPVMNVQGRASGGAVANLGGSGISTKSGNSNQGATYQFFITNTIGQEDFVELAKVVVRNNDGSDEQISNIAAKVDKDGYSALTHVISKQQKKNN